MPREHLLQVEDLVVAYGSVVALRGVSLYVPQRSIVGVLGANGAGKSTLLKAVAGAAPVTCGRIALAGERIDGLPPEEVVRRGVSLVPEGRLVFPGLTVLENLQIGAATREDRPQVSSDLERMFARFPVLKQRRSQPAGTLSGGEQQQLAIARSMMSRPRLMLLDEPSLGLAPIIVDTVFGLIAEIRDEGVTILLVEQNVHRALEVADDVSVLAAGEVVMSGPAAELGETAGLEQAYLGIASER